MHQALTGPSLAIHTWRAAVRTGRWLRRVALRPRVAHLQGQTASLRNGKHHGEATCARTVIGRPMNSCKRKP